MRYKAQAVYYSFKEEQVVAMENYNPKEGIRFDSQFEYRVFQRICDTLESSMIKIHPSYRCTQDGITIFHAPDFVIDEISVPTVIEAKGLVTADFPFRLYLFLKSFPQFQGNYYLVFDNNKSLERAFRKKIISQMVSAKWIECLELKDLNKVL
jgi:hypothetical protein